MENWQKTYVEANILELETKTTCNDLLLQQLVADGVLVDVEVESIKCNNNLVQKARTFYDIMKIKMDGYAAISKALAMSHQMEAYKLILVGYANCLSCDTHIDFLGKVKRLSEYFNEVEIQEITKLAREKLSENQYASNINNINVNAERISLLRKMELPSTSLYIPRKLFKRVVINTKLFQKNYPDIFVFMGMQSLDKLRQLVQPQLASSSTLQLRKGKLSYSFMLLDHNEDWDRILIIAQVPCHLLRYEKDTKLCILERTTGSSSISQYLGKPSMEDCTVSEVKFIENVLADSMSGPGICICDSPGMGKTLLLSKIACKLKEKCTDQLVAFISLPHFIKHLIKHSVPFNVDIATARNALLAYLSTSPLSLCILDAIISKFDISMKLLFDGFDEVDFKGIHFTKQLLTQLASHCPNTRIFVTSRPHMRHELEASLGVIAYDIMPLTAANQIEFLVSSWVSEGKDEKQDETKLTEFARYCLTNLGDRLTKDEQRITGTPLLCRILANVFFRKAKLFCRSPAKALSDIESSFQFETSLPNLYRKYIEGRFEKLNISESIFDTKKYHVWIAFKTLFPELESEYFHELSVKSDEAILKSSISMGLLERRFVENKEIAQFVHRTFAEYFVAEFLGETIINNCEPHSENFKENVAKCLLKTVLMTERIDTTDDIKGSVFIYPVVVYFLDYFTEDQSSSEPLAYTQHFENYVEPSHFCGILFGCLRDNYLNIFNFIAKNFANMAIKAKESFKTEIVPDNEEHRVIGLLNVSAVFSSLSLVDALFTFFRDNFEEPFRLESVCKNLSLDLDTPLHFAIEKANVEKIQYFARIIPFRNRKLLLSCIINSNEDTPQTVQRKVKMCQLLLSMDKDRELLAEATYTLYDSVHMEILKVLIMQGSDLDESKSDGNLIHQAAKYMSDEHFHELCRFLIKDIKACHLFKRNEKKWCSPLPCILQRPKSMMQLATIKNILNIPGIDVNEKYEDQNTLFLTAAMTKHGEKMINLLVNAGAVVNTENVYGQNALHLAAEAGNVSVIPFLIKLGVDFEHLDILQNTFLHRMVTEASAQDDYHEIISLICSTGSTDIFHVRNREQQLPFHIAVKHLELKMETLNMFKSANVDFNSVDQYNVSLLMYAVAEGRSVPFLSVLIKFGANVMVKNFLSGATFAHAISKYYSAEQYHELVTTLISTGKREAFMIADNMGRTPLYWGVHYLELLPDTLKCLHENKINFNVSDNYNNSLLSAAASGGRSVAFIKTLLDMGVDAAIQKTDGSTFVHRLQDFYSAIEYHEIMELLIERGYQRVYSVANMYGQTPLHLAVEKIKLLEDTLHLIREKLVKTGILNINYTEDEGSTILHNAIVGNYTRFTISRETPLPLLKWEKQEKNFVIYQSIKGGSKSSTPYGVWDAHHLKILIDMGADVEIQDSDGCTFAHYMPYFYSAERYHDIAELLCREGHGRVFQIADLDGLTPLHTAVYQLELLDKTLNLINSTLLQTGIVSVNLTINFGNSILATAVMGGRNVRFLETLLNLGVDPMIQDKDGNTFAHLSALHYGPEDYHCIVKLIIETCCQKVLQVVNNKGQTPLHMAMIKLELLEATLQLINSSVFQKNIVDMNCKDVDGNSFLIYAANAKRSVQLLENLMKMGMDVTIQNNVGNTFAHEIAAHYSPQEFSSLVKIIIETGQERVFQVVNQKGYSCPRVAFFELESLEETLDLFQTNMVDVNLRNKAGISLIVCAAIQKKSITCMEKLLEMGADPSISDKNGNNLAHYLPECYTPQEYHSVVQILIRKGFGSIFLMVNKDEEAPLQVAIYYLDLLEETFDLFNETLFQTNIADINYTDKEGNSLLAYAVKGRRHIDLLEKLIKMGVNPMIQNNDGNTIAHYIHEIYTPEEYHKILELLIQTGNQKVFQVINANEQNALHAAILKMELLPATLDRANVSLFETNIVDINCRGKDGNSLLGYAIFGKRSVKFLEKLMNLGIDFTIQNVYGNTFAHFIKDYYDREDYHNIAKLIIRIGVVSIYQLVNENGQTPLHTAVYTLELLDATMDLFNSFIFQTNIIDINVQDNQGNTFLTYAVIGGRSVNFLKHLLKMGADVTIQNENGNTFAHLFSQDYSPEDYHTIMELLVGMEKLNVIQVKNTEGQTALHFAILKLELLEETLALIDSTLFQPNIASRNCVDKQGNSCLVYACEGKRSVSFLKTLITMGVDVTIQNKNGNTFAHFLPEVYTSEEYHQILEGLIKTEQANVFQIANANGETPLHIAIQQLELMQETLNLIACSLLQTRIVDINATDADGNSLLVYALRGKRSVQHINNLLKIGLNPSTRNNNGDTFFHLIPFYYSPHQYHKIVNSLIAVGHTKLFQVVNNHGQSPLHLAVYYLELLGETLDLFANVYMSIKDESEGKLVMPAHSHGLNSRDNTGMSVLHRALSGKRSLLFVQHLVSLGADIFVKNNHARTIAHACASYGLVEHLKYFVGLGCDINMLDNDGNNALQCAVCDATENISGIVTFLVDTGADIRHTNNKGKTAFEQAIQKGITYMGILSALK